MPPADVILAAATVIANDWRTLAIAWHAALAVFLISLAAGWRPSGRSAGSLLAVPLLSVSALAWHSGNPFTGFACALTALMLIAGARRLPAGAVMCASPGVLAAASALIAYGWMYPHFLITQRWVAYAYASPFGLLPCPTLSAILGLALALGLHRSPMMAATLAASAILYGAIGVFTLGVALDYGLLAGAVGLLAVAAAPSLSHLNVLQHRA